MVIQSSSWSDTTFHVAGFCFDVVPAFRYLGVTLDAGGSPARMVQDVATRASAALYRLCEYVGTLGWRTPWTRLVLYDVYVRTVLLFAAPVWAPGGLQSSFPEEPPLLRPLGVLYRRGLRLLVDVPIDTRTSVLYTVTCRPPLSLPMGKAVWRYYLRLR